MSMMEAIRPPMGADLVTINAVPVTVADLENGSGSAAALRRAALDRWQAVHDPEQRLDRAHLLDAAALAALVETDDGPSFDGARLGELVEFIAELPW